MLRYKNLSQNYVLQKKKIVYGYFKNYNKPPALLISSALTKTSTNRDLYTKKNRLAHYLSYATLVTYVPVLGDEQFPFRVIFGSFCSNWFKLVSAQLPPKTNCCYHHQYFWTKFTFFAGI